ncbi:hypothetical protein [Methylocystis bryophila]|uniref:hypothetical protein n=1 Tax=Methylocystis bryophila TaxID=655015 RepID=UPI001319DC41|nr:hypothetical protein [Methylocystis bryophila]BDV39289.1 hypothetical protein DSM21852_25420 [Methylocystis bryophila]
MSKRAREIIIVAATLLASVGLSTAALAQACSPCFRPEMGDPFRCTNCEERVWTGAGWTILHTAPARSTYDYWWSSR